MELAIVRAGMGASKREYAKFLGSLEVWLPVVESISGSSDGRKRDGKDLQDLINKSGF